jgi:ubiquinone/menaquinone biosynthesis C-methylase UbiE
MNGEELAKNPRLDHYFLQDLNQDPKLPLADSSFDAVLIAVSVQYLQYPEAVFAEIQRVLTPNGFCVVSFSNRMFYQKAIAVWRDSSDADHLKLVKGYFENTPGFGTPQAIARIGNPNLPQFLQVLGIGQQDPFYAVIAQKQASMIE